MFAASVVLPDAKAMRCITFAGGETVGNREICVSDILRRHGKNASLKWRLDFVTGFKVFRSRQDGPTINGGGLRMSESCKTCRFLYQADRFLQPVCRRFPPSVRITAQTKTRKYFGVDSVDIEVESFVHPSPRLDDWCGEYRPLSQSEIRGQASAETPTPIPRPPGFVPPHPVRLVDGTEEIND